MILLNCSFSVKGYTRKGAALLGMREFGKAQRAYEDALAIEPNNQARVSSTITVV